MRRIETQLSYPILIRQDVEQHNVPPRITINNIQELSTRINNNS